MNRDQEKLFEEIRLIGSSIKNMSSWMQNDFETMIADGVTTRDEVAKSIPQMKSQFDAAFEQLTLAEAAMTSILRNAAGVKASKPSSPLLASVSSPGAAAAPVSASTPGAPPRRSYVGRR